MLAQSAHVSRDLVKAEWTNAKMDVIVRYRHQPNELQRRRVANFGGRFKKQLHLINGESYTVSVGSLEALAADPDVASIVPDRKVHMLLDNTAAAVHAAVAWNNYGLDGSGIGVAVIDSGISDHSDLQGANGIRIVFRDNFVGTDANDHFGHGEHVAGIIAGNGGDSKCSICSRNFVGIAPNVNLIDLRVLDENGEGSDSAVIAAIDEAIQLRDQYNIRVINLSLGRPVFESYQDDPLCQAVEAAWRAGIVVVVAA
ncbi:MAG TPA: S8 family serine peptidase, partial [Bryobacteraceae bacterium]